MTDRRLAGIEAEIDVQGGARWLAGIVAEADTTSLPGGIRVLLCLVAEVDVLVPAATGRTYAMWW